MHSKLFGWDWWILLYNECRKSVLKEGFATYWFPYSYIYTRKEDISSTATHIGEDRAIDDDMESILKGQRTREKFRYTIEIC